jgi:putative flavoprotein involved in K+ transport
MKVSESKYRRPRREHVVVIGAGQAGLATSAWLARVGLDHVVLERSRVGASWRERRWDSFRLVTPNWMIRLPGGAYEGPDPDGFLGRDAVADHLDRYASSLRAPVETGVHVRSLGHAGDGFRIEASSGAITARTVIVTTGTFHRARVPAWAGDLSPQIVQLAALDYRRPSALPPGGVLVVGSGQSGAQIADELHRSGRRVFLATGGAARLPRRHRGRDTMAWLAAAGAFDETVARHPLGEAVRRHANAHVAGGATLDLRRLGGDGVRLFGRAIGGAGRHVVFAGDLEAHLAAADRGAARFQALADAYIDGCREPASDEREAPHAWAPARTPTSLDLRAEGVTAVIWAGGLGPDFSWIRLPVFDAHGYPRVRRGLTAVPGLAFVGLHWMHRWSSGLFFGVGRDAAHVVSRLAISEGVPAPDVRPSFPPLTTGGLR